MTLGTILIALGLIAAAFVAYGLCALWHFAEMNARADDDIYPLSRRDLK